MRPFRNNKVGWISYYVSAYICPMKKQNFERSTFPHARYIASTETDKEQNIHPKWEKLYSWQLLRTSN